MENGSIWNNGSNYPQYNIPSITETGNSSFNSGITHILDPTKYLTSDDSGFVQGFWNDLMGFTSQNREFAQQEYLMDKQNAYNDPSAQMERLGKAGINLNLAAGGVAQGGNESAQAPSVPSNQNGVASGLGSAASFLGGVSGAAMNAANKRLLSAQAENFDASTKNILAMIQPQLDQMAANTAALWAKKGLDSNQARYWSVKSVYAGTQERMDILSKGWSIKHCQKEITLLKDEHDQNIEKLKILKEQLSQEEYQTEQMRIDTVLKKGIEQVYNKYGVDLTLPENAMLIEAEANGHLDDILDVFGQGSYAQYYAQYSAQADTAYDNAYNAAVGAAEGNEENQKFVTALETYKEQCKAFYAAYYALPDDLKALLAQTLGQGKFTAVDIGKRILDPKESPKLNHRKPKESKFSAPKIVRKEHGVSIRF